MFVWWCTEFPCQVMAIHLPSTGLSWGHVTAFCKDKDIFYKAIYHCQIHGYLLHLKAIEISAAVHYYDSWWYIHNELAYTWWLVSVFWTDKNTLILYNVKRLVACIDSLNRCRLLWCYLLRISTPFWLTHCREIFCSWTEFNVRWNAFLGALLLSWISFNTSTNK